MVGSIYRAGDVGFVYSGGAYTLMTGVIPYGINDVRQVVGYMPNSSGHNQGVLLSGGTLTPINFPGAYGTIAYGINRLGQISGTYTNYTDGVFSDHGFVYSEGVFTTVDYATVDYTGYNTHIYGINDYGQVVGYYTLSGDADPIASFVASPVPEPRTASVVAGSSLILIAMLLARNCQGGPHPPERSQPSVAA
jgi:hypothetical protein